MQTEGVAQIRPPTSREFERARRLAYEKFGLDLRDGNEPLVAARLGKKLGQLGLRTYREYLDQVQADASGDLLTGMIDALTTNHTMFLREPAHFVFLRQVVRAELRKRSPLEIWSAACSTGEEPYSIAICLLEELGAEAASRIRIVASDVSSRVLETAKHGVYAAERFEGFPAAWMSRYFLRGEKQRLGWYRVKAALRRLVDFRPINLMEPLGNMPRFRSSSAATSCSTSTRPRSGSWWAGWRAAWNRVVTWWWATRRGWWAKVGRWSTSSRRCTGSRWMARPRAGGRRAGHAPGNCGNRRLPDQHRPRQRAGDLCLGSCIAVAIYDAVAGVAGMLHFMLPESSIDPDRARERPYMFADTGIPRLFRAAYQRGAEKERIMVRVAAAPR